MPGRSDAPPSEPSGPAAPAFKVLRRLLRRAELARIAGRPCPMTQWDEVGLPAASLDPSRRALARAEEAGAVELVRHSGFRSDLIRALKVRDPDALARFLGEERYGNLLARLDAALEGALAGAAEWVAELADRCRSRWARGEAPFGLRPGDPDAARECFLLLRALAEERAGGVDPRTFSLEAAGRTKALEERRRSVVAALRATFSFEDGMSADDILGAFGLARFRQPLLLRAALDLGSQRDVQVSPYVGVPEELAASLVPARRAPYLLIIENLTTFNRYVREVSDDGFVLYAGGFPTVACRVAAARLAAGADAAYHWGDIDPGGVRIFRVLEAAVEGLRPHLMTTGIARERGREMEGDPGLAALATSDSAVAELASFLSCERTWMLEQEALALAAPAG